MNVIDVNDVVPTFLDPAYNGLVAENQPIGSQVAVVSITSDVVTPLATLEALC